MIHYSHGKWGVAFIFQLHGSIFPKALMWAIPAAVVSAMMNYVKMQSGKSTSDSPTTVLTSFSSFITIMGFMVVFRSNQAWSRFWEGAALVQQARGEWFNATSSMFAFCTRKPEKRDEVERFQRQMVRMMSLLYGSALGSLSGDAQFSVINQDGMDDSFVQFVDRVSPPAMDIKCEVILQWVQRAVTESIEGGVLSAAPPILSRIFQELSRGVVNIASARKINELPFPFPYAQMMSVILIAYTCGVPCAAGYVMETWWGAAGSTFANVFVLWSVNYLAADIEQPFGHGWNHLPLSQEMDRMNELLKMLLHKEMSSTPTYRESRTSEVETAFLLGSPVLNWQTVTRNSVMPHPCVDFNGSVPKTTTLKGGVGMSAALHSKPRLQPFVEGQENTIENDFHRPHLEPPKEIDISPVAIRRPQNKPGFAGGRVPSLDDEAKKNVRTHPTPTGLPNLIADADDYDMAAWSENKGVPPPTRKMQEGSPRSVVAPEEMLGPFGMDEDIPTPSSPTDEKRPKTSGGTATTTASNGSGRPRLGAGNANEEWAFAQPQKILANPPTAPQSPSGRSRRGGSPGTSPRSGSPRSGSPRSNVGGSGWTRQASNSETVM